MSTPWCDGGVALVPDCSDMMTAMELSSLEPRDQDVVVVHASTGGDGSGRPSLPERYALVEWGAYEFVSDGLRSLTHERAVLEARLCASERGRDAWDTTGPRIQRLRRLPLVYRSGPETYSISLDVTDYTDARAVLRWQSKSNLSESDVRRELGKDGVPVALATALIGKAPMPEACIGEPVGSERIPERH